MVVKICAPSEDIDKQIRDRRWCQWLASGVSLILRATVNLAFDEVRLLAVSPGQDFGARTPWALLPSKEANFSSGVLLFQLSREQFV